MRNRVLIVDDSEMIRNFHSYILKSAGYQTDTAENGAIALEKALVGSYDLIVTDINMPTMDGYEFIKKLREQKVKIPIIVVSTEDEYRDRIKGIRAGANTYIVKPTEPETLVLTAKKLLG